MGTIGCCDDRHVLNQIDSPRNNKNNNTNKKEQSKQDEAENQIIMEFKIDPTLSQKENFNLRESHKNPNIEAPSQAFIQTDKLILNKNEESYLSTNLDSFENKQPIYKRKRKINLNSENDNSSRKIDDSKEMKVDNTDVKHVENIDNINKPEFDNSHSETNFTKEIVDINKESFLIMKKESSGIQGKNPYRKEKKVSKTLENSSTNNLNEGNYRFISEDENKCINNNSELKISLSSSIQTNQDNSNKESGINNEKENEKTINNSNEKSNSSIQYNSLDNSLKYKRSFNEKKQIAVSNSNTSKKDLELSKESYVKLLKERNDKKQTINSEKIENNNTSFKQRLLAIESKNLISIKSTDNIQINKFKKLDTISEKEHKFLNDSFNIIRSSTSREKTITQEFTRKPSKMRSQKIMKLAFALEKHLLEGDGKNNPDNVKDDSPFDDILNNRSIISRNVRKKNRNLFV